MPSFVKSQKDFLAGLLFVVIAVVFGIGILELPIGTAFRMGPGYFPMMLAGLLAVLGAVIMFNGMRAEDEPIRNFAWRGLINIVLPVVFFGATLKGLGFILSLGLTIFFTSLASSKFKVWVALVNVAVLVFFSWMIFIWGLNLPIPIWGPWVGGY
jgi:putative tricarboxylic transport membrane protein